MMDFFEALKEIRNVLDQQDQGLLTNEETWVKILDIIAHTAPIKKR